MITRPGLMDLFHPVDFFLPIWLFLPSFLPSFHKRIGPEEVSRYYQIIALRHWRVELQPEELKTGRCALFDDLNWESAERWNGSYFRVLKQEEREKDFPSILFLFLLQNRSTECVSPNGVGVAQRGAELLLSRTIPTWWIVSRLPLGPIALRYLFIFRAAEMLSLSETPRWHKRRRRKKKVSFDNISLWVAALEEI